MRVIVVAGARPNFVKVKPVVAALEARGVEVVLVHTGQHYDRAMSDVFFTELGIRPPDLSLNVGSGPHGVQTARILEAFEPVVADVDPDVVVVVGDVNSTLGCALVGAKAGCLVAHVEAGLRSRDWAMPEEVNRVVADRVSDYLFAPSHDAVDNLRSEGYRSDQIHLVGNVMIDTLLANLERARSGPTLKRFGLVPGEYGVITLHRPANVDDPVVLRRILGAVAEIASELPLVFPVHPRTAAQLGEYQEAGGLIVVPAASYLEFIALEASARLVLTDSGGVQEETTALGVACLTLRDSTERPVTVSEGTNRVVGTDPARIVAEARSVLEHGVEARRPALWDGRAGERIATALADVDEVAGHRRPTETEG